MLQMSAKTYVDVLQDKAVDFAPSMAVEQAVDETSKAVQALQDEAVEAVEAALGADTAVEATVAYARHAGSAADVDHTSICCLPLTMLPDRRRWFLRPAVPPPTPLPFDPTSRVGERTDVAFDDVWFPGTVVAVNSPRAHAFAYTVAFDDGDEATDVALQDMRLAAVQPLATQVHSSSMPSYTSA